MAHVPRVYRPGVRGPGPLAIDGEQGRHLATVLRLRPGDPFLVFAGDGREWSATVEAVERSRIAARVHDLARQEGPLALALELWCALLRPARFELLIEKCTEAGADVIRPLTSDFTSRSDAPSAARLQRWNRIAIEAAEQSGRLVVPVIAPVTSIGTALAAAHQPVVFADPEGRPWREVVPLLPGEGRIAVAIGPEGGWSPAERAAATARGALSARIGTTVFRSETAAIVFTALVRAST
jgi:16S rRNA (uracil1498-N3)-methyltransferase